MASISGFNHWINIKRPEYNGFNKIKYGKLVGIGDSVLNLSQKQDVLKIIKSKQNTFSKFKIDN